MTARRSWRERLEFIDRRWLFLILAFAIVLPLVVDLPLPLYVSPMVQDLYDAIEDLPDGSTVLISADYDPSGKPELEPFHLALIHQLAEKKVKMVMYSLWPAATPITEAVLAEAGLTTDYGYRKDVDYVLLGYKEGQQIAMRSIQKSLKGTFPVDRDGTPSNEIPLLQHYDTYTDFAMLINVSAGSPGVKEYVQNVQSITGVPMVAACTAVSGPDYVPYYKAGQLLGLAAGMKGAAEYEKLVGRPGLAMAGMSAQSASHILLIAFIVFGNVMYFLARRSGGAR
ncbi:MAG: hypothetical protein KC591_10405 [Gemmatimonadetes bacterium]|nr:hypothetical protein [Gemmatimonadota bacterium]